ncbi:MAG: bifunctional serine/threonine-protein kinase/formylglycine-generating enzyme family protein [Simkaniaceae bacterium]|nr:bifunctional serine/threonine-protein kinase/formylglycine-generating enzyme family protein [Simkaniaceae bacterium]
MEERILGDYEIVKLLGEGPLGKVYLANHRFIKRPFVLKLLPPNLQDDPAFVERFTNEIATLATLDHSNIVKVHNVSHVDSTYFLTCECIVDSDRISTSIFDYFQARGGELSEDEIYLLLSQIASALDYIHQKTIAGMPLAHRALKFNNLLMGSRLGEGPCVYLSDTGLAHIIGESVLISKAFQVVSENIGIKSTHPDLNQLQSSFMQSFAFLAPEQKVGKDFSGTQADVFAFGVLTYFLLSGEYPEGIFPLPSEFGRTQSYDWDRLVSSCLQLDPRKRPHSLTELLQSISGGQRSKQSFDRKIPLDDLSRMDITKPKPPAPSPTPTAPVAPSQPQVPQAAPRPPMTPKPKKPPSQLDSITMNLTPRMASAQQIVSSPAAVAVQTEVQPVIKPQELERPEYEEDPGAIFQKETTVAPYKPKEKELKTVEPLLTDMVLVQGGEYYRGCNEGARDERPQHMVHLEGYAMDVHPVTNQQFVRFLEAMGGEKDHTNHDIIRLRDSRIRKQDGKYLVESGYGSHPVVGVSWYGAVAYAKWVGKRLPTEAEWEVACRGTIRDVIYPTGNDIDKDHANYFSADTTPVMTFQPNSVGLYDMVGNVYEWCADWYDYNFYESSIHEPHNPVGPAQGVYRVLRGGCWKSLKDDLRCAHRHRNNPGTINGTYGFRCASDTKVL